MVSPPTGQSNDEESEDEDEDKEEESEEESSHRKRKRPIKDKDSKAPAKAPSRSGPSLADVAEPPNVFGPGKDAEYFQNVIDEPYIMFDDLQVDLLRLGSSGSEDLVFADVQVNLDLFKGYTIW